jgi:predicted permease
MFIRSYAKLSAVDTGFSQSPLTMNLSLDSRYVTTEQRRAFFRNVMSTIAALPGVQVAGAIGFLPLNHSETVAIITAEGYANTENQLVESWSATEQYFRAIGTPLIEGRFFNETEIGNDSRVVIVNESFARKYFPHKDGLGKHICFCAPSSRGFTWLTIVGVVAGVRNLNLEDEPPPQIYTPFWGQDSHQAYIVVRTKFPPDKMIPSIRRAVQGIDPALAVADIRTMEQREEAAAAPRRFQTFLFAIFAGVALLLAAVGLYGTIAYSVRQRTQEIGIRLALGARRADIVRAVIYEGMTLTVLGLFLGVTGALGLTRLLAKMLYGVAPNDPGTFVIVSVVLALVALAACYIPARRAMHVEPMVALRYE